MPSMFSESEVLEANGLIYDQLMSRDPGMNKRAEYGIEEYTRTTVREQGYGRQILPMLPITNDKLHRQQYTDENVRIEELEATVPGAMSVGYGTVPMTLYIAADKYSVTFGRIMSRRYTKDISQLRTWAQDIRQVMSDMSARELEVEEDAKFTTSHLSAMVGVNTVVPTSGVVQWLTINGGMTRDMLAESLKVMPNTPFNIEVKKVLINQITVKDLMKLGYNEFGGDIAGEVMLKGWTLVTLQGVDYLITIKKGLVQTGRMFMYGPPSYMGKSYELEAPTLFASRRGFMLEFYMYEEVGSTFGHTGALAVIDYTG